MRLLLDTHIWLWSLLEPERLSPRVTRAVTGRDNERWLSPISTWEFLMLVAKRRITLDREPEAWLAEAMRAMPVHEAPFTHDVALAARAMKLAHRDPADTFLAATARVFDLTLVTADRRLIAAKGVSVLANR